MPYGFESTSSPVGLLAASKFSEILDRSLLLRGSSRSSRANRRPSGTKQGFTLRGIPTEADRHEREAERIEINVVRPGGEFATFGLQSPVTAARWRRVRHCECAGPNA